MEHPCPKCGALVEDGVPFCPQCNAPQIRVQSAVTSPATPPMPPGTPDELQPPAEPLSHAAHQPRHHQYAPPPAPTDGLNRRSVIRAALWAGIIAGFGSAIPFVPIIVLSMVAAGGMSIAFYMRREPSKGVQPGEGFRIGVLAGLFGFLINALFSIGSMLITSIRAAARAEMIARWNEAMSRTADPQALDTLHRIGDTLSTPGGLAFMFVFVLLVQAVLFVIFGGLGGTIGASLFGRKQA